MTDEPKTTVVNIRHNQTEFDAYIGRVGLGFKGEFGNPYRIGRDGTREDTIKKFKKYFFNRIASDHEFKNKVLQLKGLRLGCFCSPKICHGDTIATYLNNISTHQE